MAELAPIFHDLVRFQIVLWNAVDARLRADHDVPLGWFETMQVIDGREACRVNDIAGELVITVGGTSKLVDRLEAVGHCARRANPDDRRSSIVELTASGQRLLSAASRSVQDELELRLGSVLPARTLQQFGATLSQLRAAARQHRSPERMK